MENNSQPKRARSYIEPIKWCRYLVNTGYVTAALMILAHVIWYFAARSVLAFPPDIYLRNYIVLPAAGLFAFTWLTDLFVRSPRFSLPAKEHLSLSLFILFSLYLCLTHDIAKVLLGSFILPIFVSTIFSNIRITRRIFWMSCLSALVLGVKLYLAGELESSMAMELFVACFMFLCSYLLAKILIRYGHDNLTALMYFDSQQQSMQEQLKLDPFTGLYNRKTFDDCLPMLMNECRSAGKCLCLAMIDVDHFKFVNDRYGHAVGDRVLLNLSQILKDIQAETIHVFRMGGDEFSVIFWDCCAQEAYRICDELRVRIGYACRSDPEERQVTISCGLACMDLQHASLEALTKSADSALYEAKNNGRNQVVIFRDSIVKQSQSS